MWGPLILMLALGNTDAEPMRCLLRISTRGIFVDGDLMSRAAAITICKRRAGATVVLEEDAPKATWDQIRAELEHAHVSILMRGRIAPPWECIDNPFATTCVAPRCIENPLAEGCLR